MSAARSSPGPGANSNIARVRDGAPADVDAALDVIWHDLECGGYDVDLPLWREMAASVARGPVLDLGAGTGRVALDLGRRGHDVTALELDPGLASALRSRAGGLLIDVVVGDARSFSLERSFALVLVPMQTVQLLADAEERAALLHCARQHAGPGAQIVLAIADALDGYDADHREPPLPDMRELDGALYASRPVRVVDEGAHVRIERLREIVDRSGQRRESMDVVRLARLDADRLEAEGRAVGLRPAPRRHVPQTDEFVGSTVVVFDA